MVIKIVDNIEPSINNNPQSINIIIWNFMPYLALEYHTLMLKTGQDDLRNRIAPRLRDFYVNKKNDGWDPMRGAVNWYKAYMEKTYCQETNGYTCQRPAASMKHLGDGSVGKWWNMKRGSLNENAIFQIYLEN